MILKAFKDKSNQKYVNSLLAARKTNVNTNKVKTIGVLLNAEEFHEFEVFRAYFKELNLRSPKHKIIAFTPNDKLEHNKWNTHFSPKDFGWKGKINNVDLQSFIEEPYDALICFYKQNVLELNIISIASKANFKVGISRENEKFHDLIIDVNLSQIDVFKNEFKKYLTILNKL